MNIKEFYGYVPATSRNILKIISSSLMSNKWNTISDADLTQMSNDIWVYNMRKDLSPIIEDYCDLNSIDIPTLTTTNFQNIVRFLYLKYVDKWTKLWDYVYLKTYNPIWNVEGSDSTVRTFEHGKTTTETKDFTIEHGRDSTDTETVTDNITDNDVYGFNSSSPVGASKSTNNGERTTEYTGSDTDTHSGTDTFANSGVDTERTTLTRGMNLGIQSTQSLLEQEIELRKKFNYFEIVMKDIIRELAINVY